MIDPRLLPTAARDFAPDPGAVPALFRDVGEQAWHRLVKFFTADTRNRNTREAYARAVGRSSRRCDDHHLALRQLTPPYVAAYIEGGWVVPLPTECRAAPGRRADALRLPRRRPGRPE